MLKIYNSKTKTIDVFEHPIENVLNIYTCGPTVYSRPHLGNLKTFLMSDFFVQVFKAFNYNVNAIMNITDIDDKIINRLEEQTYENLINFTKNFTDLFLEDLKKLGIKNYTNLNIFKVTDHINEITDFISKLLELNFAYVISDGSIYFDSSKVEKYPFPEYQKTENNLSKRNIIRSTEVRSPNDFILWKVKDEKLKFQGLNFASGRPGWHIECSAICKKQLNSVDIHMGGEDLKFPHHTCEILQSESISDKIFGKLWIHMGFLDFKGEKMSKSIGNVLKLDDFSENYFLLRMYFLSKSYRANFDFNINEIEVFKMDFVNLHMLYSKLYNKYYTVLENNNIDNITIYQEILEILSNDFNSKDALVKINEYVAFLGWRQTSRIFIKSSSLLPV